MFEIVHLISENVFEITDSRMKFGMLSADSLELPGAPVLTWFNFDSSMHKESHA